jgi:hypothetical protein
VLAGAPGSVVVPDAALEVGPGVWTLVGGVGRISGFAGVGEAGGVNAGTSGVRISETDTLAP